MEAFYESDLAYIHDSGFGRLAEDAARFVIEELHRSGHREGRVVDLGCGSGISARILSEAGFQVLGVDLSEAMICLARRRAPDAEFRVGSWDTAEIPDCVGVMAIGEVLSYRVGPPGQDARATLSRQRRVLEKVSRSLEPGGLLVFDIATRERAPSQGPDRSYFEGPDWVVLVQSEANEERTVLTRRMTTFRRSGDLFDRSVECHHLELFDPDEILELLRKTGFSGVQSVNAYGSHPLPPGVTAFLGAK